jgi:hypothetical protein
VGDAAGERDGRLLSPVEGVLAVLSEGSATGTNKFGLLLALIDLAPEVDPASRRLLYRRLAWRVLELHWDHARPFDQGEPLRQVRARRDQQLVVVVEAARLGALAGNPGVSFERARLLVPEMEWESSVARVQRSLADWPVKHLQNLPGNAQPFLYVTGRGSLTFLPSVLEELIAFGPVLRELVESRFVRFVMEANGSSFAELALREHLFGAERHTPGPELRSALFDLQSGRCLYSGNRIDARSGHLDHVMPWSRTRLSALGNFAVVEPRLNGAKSDALLAPAPLGRWLDHLTTNRVALTEIGATGQWPTDLPRVLTVSRALYRAARPGTATWSPSGVEALTADSRTSALRLLDEALTG